MQKDILKKIHNFLLESPVETHPVVYSYLELICIESCSKGLFNV